MADQKAQLLLAGRREGPKGLNIEFIDTDGSAAKFSDLGDATTWVADDHYTVVDVIGDGTTAPATALKAQANVNGNDRSKFVNYANVFDPKSTTLGRIGALAGAEIPQGTNLRFISRA